MPQLPLGQIQAAGKALGGYHFRMEYTPGIFYEGDLDVSQNRQHFLIGHARSGDPPAEVFWEGAEGYGTAQGSARWVRLHGSPLPDLHKSAIDLLHPESIVSVREEASSWVAEVRPQFLAPRDDTENWVRGTFGEARNDKMRATLQRVTDLARTLEVKTTLVISRGSHLIERVDVHTQSRDVSSQFSMTFSPLPGTVRRLPAGVREVAETGLKVPHEALLVRFKKVGGWDCREQHCPWAQRSIQLIREEDATKRHGDKLYEEVYAKEFMAQELPTNPPYQDFDPNQANQPWHPITLGANYEDSTGERKAGSPADSKPSRALPPFYDEWFAGNDQFVQYFNQPPYFRSFNHYGGDGEGLEYTSWMCVLSDPPAPQYTCKNSKGKDCYYSARDWGYGARDWGYGPPRIDEKWNLMTWKRAIEQYNLYSLAGKRNAYLMLGHVIHLLEDQSQPDHSKLVAHAASGSNEEEAYNTFKYCEISAANSAAIAAAACGVWFWICGPAAYGIHYAACRGSINKDQVGFERLAGDIWQLSQVETVLSQTGVIKESNYDAYFHTMSDFAKNTVGQIQQQYPHANLESPLGCGGLTLTIGVTAPGTDPFINEKDAGQCEPYMKLIDKLAPQTIGLCAGLIEHFFDIVNYPPLVERVMIVQGDAGATPRGFGKVADDSTQGVCYDASWQQKQDGRVLVENPLHPKQQLSTERQYCVFLLFGPSQVGPLKGKRMDDVRLTMRSKDNSGRVNIQVAMQPGDDSDVGRYYWGWLHPVNWGDDAQMVTLEIAGKDHGPHYAARNHAGDILDGDPATIAKVDINSPNFNWVGYSPGNDTNHEVTLGPTIVANELVSFALE